ncbi:MAG: phenylalanine--tRNA ligase subunit beta [bacterium]|nr:phenylalanine--tRNA ligase subunit beta [bacterium]
MNISYNWLRKYIDIPYTPEELVEKLTMVGIEVESVSKTNILPEGLIVAEIIERNPHPNADKLSVCNVSTGAEELQIVCGAPNCDAGKKIVLATIGTVFDDDGKKFKIKKSKLRGVESYGMLCSSSELGLDEDHSGIMELPLDTITGIPLKDLYKSDTVYELELTPNRPDWLSFIGVARDIRALSGNELKLPEINMPEVKKVEDYSDLITIKDYELCPRYTGRIIRDVTVKESPDWLKKALISIGLRPINNIVDITNYVLFESGQPLHVFDLDELKENRVIIRRAEKNEKIIALDGKEYILTNDNLVIADAEKPVCIAGVMGGEHSGVTEKTKNILIECAYFNKSNIRATSHKLGLSSDSSHRFERGIDNEIINRVSDRTASLILELAGGIICSNFIDIKDENFIPVPKTVECRFKNIRNLLGTNISNEKMIDIFQKLELTVENIDDEKCYVVASSFRLDIEREADLAEEIIRIYGLEKLPLVDVFVKQGSSIKQDAYLKIEKARNQLVSFGFTEAINYTLVDKMTVLKNEVFKECDLVEVSNPISTENSVMRPSLIHGLMQNIKKNISHNNHEIKIFEIGKVYSADKTYPEERYSCCIALTGRKHPERYSDEKNICYDFYDLKGLLESWLEERNIDKIICEKSDSSVFKEGIRSDFIINDKILISFGEISSIFTKGMRLKAPVFVAVIELDKILKVKEKPVQYKTVSQFPSTSRDFALVVDKSLESSQIIEVVNNLKCKILEKIELFDLYEDDSLGKNKKSLAYSLTYRSSNKTLTDKEVNTTHEKIRNVLSNKLQIELR